MMRRRELLGAGQVFALPALPGCQATSGDPAGNARIIDWELVPVRATYRTVWLFVRLYTDTGLVGTGEASDAFGFANTTVVNAAAMEAELAEFMSLVANRSPLDIQQYRTRGRSRALRGLVSATAFSAIEQCLWDLSGQVLGVPTYAFFGGKVRDSIPVYANINRATSPRTPVGFADTARWAHDDGFRAMKAAPFDNYPANGTANEIDAHVRNGIDALYAMREAVGAETAIMVDCHSFFTIPQAIDIAARLEAVNLSWYEEPIPPDQVDATVAIRGGISLAMAGGELLFGLEGFRPLIERRVYDVIMPDVKHCGGLQEMLHIAALAAVENMQVAPHNPSGPVSTAAGVQAGAAIPNCSYLELQYGEVDWRDETLIPGERFVNGEIRVPDSPGFGISLNESVISANQLPL